MKLVSVDSDSKKKIVQVSEWVQLMKDNIRLIRQGNQKMKYNKCQHAAGRFSHSILCCPCLTWSVICRCILSPFQAKQRGYIYACVGNKYTKKTDELYCGTLDKLNKCYVLPRLPELNTLTIEDNNILKAAIDDCIRDFNCDISPEGLYSKQHYALHDLIMPSIKDALGKPDYKTTPYNVNEVLNEFTLKLSSLQTVRI